MLIFACLRVGEIKEANLNVSQPPGLERLEKLSVVVWSVWSIAETSRVEGSHT